MSRSLQKAYRRYRSIRVLVHGCNGLEEAIEVSHLVVSALLLLSYGIRSGMVIVVEAQFNDKCLRIIVDSNRVRGLNADYYTGRGLILNALKKGRSKGLRVTIKACEGRMEGVADNAETVFIEAVGELRGEEPYLAMPCKASYAFILAASMIYVDGYSYGEGW